MICLGGVALLFLVARLLHAQDLLEPVLDWISGLGAWGPAIYIAIFVFASLLFVPGSVLTLGAGALFGLLKGSVCVSVASFLSAIGAFLISRYFVRAAISRRIAGNETFLALDKAVAREGWKIVGLIRLSPVFPFTPLNYSFGLTGVSLRVYAIASWIGMIPGTVMYVYLGSLVRSGASQHSRTPLEWGFYGTGFIATVAVTAIITRLARKSLARKISGQPACLSDTNAAKSCSA